MKNYIIIITSILVISLGCNQSDSPDIDYIEEKDSTRTKGRSGNFIFNNDSKGSIPWGFTPNNCQCQDSSENHSELPIKLSTEGNYTDYRLWLDGTEVILEDNAFEYDDFQLNSDSLCLHMTLQARSGNVGITINMNDEEYTFSDNSNSNLIHVNIPLTKWKIDSTPSTENELANL